jgi:predicted O-linked N-acetylglucosamine transferase (SPINDLY family)
MSTGRPDYSTSPTANAIPASVTTSELTLTLPEAFSRAVFAYRGGRLVEAEQICRQILQAKPDFFDALHLLALVQSSLGKKEAALASYDRALAVRPDCAEALSNRGLLLHELGRYGEALASYDYALAIQPDFAEALFNRGNTLLELKQYDAALAGYERALRLRPDYAKALANRGMALHALARFEEALASSDRALAVRPDYPEALFNRGNALRELKRFDEALASYDRALAVRSDYADALANRAVILRELRRYEEALASCERALALRGDFAEVLSNRGNILRELGRYDEALASYDRALALRPDYAEALTNRGLTLHGLNRFDEALMHHERALAARPDLAEALANRGLALHRLKRTEEALASYERALRSRPDYPEAHCMLGVTLIELGRLPQARAALQRAVELAPGKVRYYRNLADIARFIPGDAHLPALEKLAGSDAALSEDERIELHFALGQAYEDLGRHPEAFAHWHNGNALKRRQVAYDEAATLTRLNGMRATFTSDLVARWQNVGHQSCLPVFIVGMARSGSTLVEQILASHPQVFGAGELDYFAEAVRAASSKFRDARQQTSTLTAEDFRDLGQRYIAAVERHAPQAGRITDKMPGNFVFAGLIHLALPNATIIHTVRDPVDTCVSCFSKLFKEQPHTYDLAELGRYYRHYRALMAHWHKVLPPGRILDVCYEDVVADLEGQARRIIAHCGLPWDPRCLEFHKTQRPVFTVSAAQVRQPIYNSAVGRWRVHEQALAPLLAELGIADAHDYRDAGHHYDLGNELYGQGRINEAVAAYRDAVRIKPDHAEAHCNLGNALKQRGDLNEAVDAYRTAIANKPNYAKAYYNLGLALREHGKRDQAVDAWRRAVVLDPNMAEAHSDLGVALQELGRLDEAIAAYRQAIRIKPDYDRAHHNLGIALKEQGKIGEAIAAWRQAIGIRPRSAEALSDLGHALTLEHKLDEAVAACRQAIRINPRHAEAHCNLGTALREQGKLDDAIAAYREAIRINPAFAEFHCNLGVALAERGKLDEAVAAHREAINQKPDYAVGHSNLGVGLQEQGKLEEAVTAYRKAISLKPQFAEAHSNLGNALCQAGHLEAAVTACREAIGIKPDYAEAQCNLGVALQYQGKLDAAAAAYRKAIGVKPEHSTTLSNLLFCLNYAENVSNAELFAAHREWEERHGRAAVRFASHANERDPQRRLRIGYVSPDFRVHSVAYFLEPLLAAHDRQAVEVFCYADVSRPDRLTEHMRQFAEHWLVSVGLSDDELAERIRSDGVDVLVDLAGHTADNRLRVFARKPAPVQVTWLGYPNTTGLTAIDYRLVDPVTDPPGQSETWASESLFRLDGGFLCYGGFADLPDPKPPPCLTSGTVTFGSFNNPAKLSTATMDAFARLIAAVPHARLLLKGKPLADPATRALYQTRLVERGVPAERLELIPALPSPVAHLAAYQLVDVALDPFPYNGTTTTCEALWMGVPVVTLRGDRHAGRVGASLLTQIGLTDLIAGSVDEYTAIAAALARDPARLAALRRSLRPRMLVSPLCDARAFARKMEAAFRMMWQRWCEAAATSS